MTQTAKKRLQLGTVGTYHHHWLNLIWIGFFVLFYVVEHTVTENYWVSHLPADARIPFLPGFVIPYCMWYPMLFAATMYTMLFDKDAYIRFMLFIGIGFYGSLAFCLLFPNGQDLRPAVFEHPTFFTWLLGRIYAADTNTNVLPSMHVIGCAAVFCASLDAKDLRARGVPWAVLPLSVLVSLSTVFVKQHSILDVYVAIPVSVLLALAIYLPQLLRARREKASAKRKP